MVPVLIELRLVVAFKARRHKKICGMEGKEEAAQKEEASSSGSSYLVGWLVVNFKASLERICGMAGKEEEAAAQAVLIWLVVAVLIWLVGLVGCCL